MFFPGRVPAFSKKGWQISLEECGATLVNKATIKFTTDQHSVANERYLKYFVEIILKLKFLIYRTYSDRYNTFSQQLPFSSLKLFQQK
jgi:hypothetical protein